MKKQLLIALLASAAFAPAAQASDDYIGGNIGVVGHKGTLDALGSDTQSDLGYGAYYGHQINKNLGVEIAVTDLGKFEYAKVRVAPVSVSAAMVASFPVSNSASLFGKLGFSRNRTEVTGPGFANKENDTNTLLGFGATFAVSKQFSLVVQYDHYFRVINDSGDYVKTGMLSGGVRYGF